MSKMADEGIAHGAHGRQTKQVSRNQWCKQWMARIENRAGIVIVADAGKWYE